MAERGRPKSPANNGNGSRADFCQRIKNLRILLGFNQKAFGRQIGVSMWAVYRWEGVDGKNYPSKENWERILRLEEMNFQEKES